MKLLIFLNKFSTQNLQIILIKLLMESQHDIAAVILLEIENVMMHRFTKDNKTLFTSGTCKFAKIENSQSRTVYFININSFYYTLNKNTPFIKLQYPDTISYLFPHFDNGMSAITLQINSPQIYNVEQILKNSAVLATFDNAMNDPAIRLKIQENCPNVQKQQIYSPDKVKLTISKSGKYLGKAFSAAGYYLSKGIQLTGNYIAEKLEPGQKQFQPQTKQKWENLKKGTGNAFKVSGQYLSKVWNPVKEKTCQWATGLGEKMDKSQNTSIHYTKELAVTSGKAVGDLWSGLVQGTKTASSQLGNQTRKIAQKKMGQKTVKQIMGEKQDDKQKKQEEAPLQQAKEQSKQVVYQTIDQPKEKNEQKMQYPETNSQVYNEEQTYPQLNEEKKKDEFGHSQ